jgi:pSer/pThr/pTyr-binding forkhead associated (FHA) protein
MVTRVILGRAENCDIVVRDEYASPRHAAIEQIADRFVIYDLGSTNGTRIRRGRKDIPVPLGSIMALAVGDEVVIGRTAIPWRRA